jgi:hypothetical protein
MAASDTTDYSDNETGQESRAHQDDQVGGEKGEDELIGLLEVKGGAAEVDPKNEEADEEQPQERLTHPPDEGLHHDRLLPSSPHYAPITCCGR